MGIRKTCNESLGCMVILFIAAILLSPGFSFSSGFSNQLAFADEDEPNENENGDTKSRLAKLVNRINQLQVYLNQIEENKAALEGLEDQYSDIIDVLEAASAAAPDHRIAYAGSDIAEVDILAARELLIKQFL